MSANSAKGDEASSPKTSVRQIWKALMCEDVYNAFSSPFKVRAREDQHQLIPQQDMWPRPLSVRVRNSLGQCFSFHLLFLSQSFLEDAHKVF